MLSLFVSVLSVFVAVLLFSFHILKKVSKPNIYLSIFFLVYGIYGISHYIMLESSNTFLYAFFFNNFTPLYVLIGPSIYLYVKKTINDESCVLCKDELLHLIPTLITIIDLSPYLFKSFEFKTQFANEILINSNNISLTPHLIFNDYLGSLYRQILNLAYLLLTIKLILFPKKSIVISNKQEKIVMNWIKLLVVTVTSFFVFMLLYLISLKLKIGNNNSDNLSSIYLKITWIIHAILIVIIFSFPTILYGIPQLTPSNPFFKNYTDPIDNSDLIKDERIVEEKKQYKAFELEATYLDEINLLIEDYIKKQPFLLDKFSMSVLTTETKIPMHHLNLYFKNYLNTNFNTWKNKLKINYALTLIDSGILNQITIEAVALKSGFKSYSNFFTVFKNNTGISPSEYIDKLK